MARILSSELHKNDRASSAFGFCVQSLLRSARFHAGELEKGKSADIGAPGSIHALAKVCDGESRLHVPKEEIELWKKNFFGWLKRVERHFPPELLQAYQENAEADFNRILKGATSSPPSFWRAASLEREFSITFPDEESLQRAHEAAKTHHPVQLGIALRKYLENCVESLVNQPHKGPSEETRPQLSERPRELSVNITLTEGGSFLVAVTDFNAFASIDDLKDDIVPDAYDVERALSECLTADQHKGVNFSCESSLLTVSMSSADLLGIVTEQLFQLADRKLCPNARS